MHADGAAKLGQLLFQLENSIATIHDEELLIGDAVSVFAVAEPVETVVNFAIPWRFYLPCHLLYIFEHVEPEVN